jgi:predicted membrane-bound spermidine synthase
VTPYLCRNIMSLATSTIGLILFVRPASMSVMALSPKFIPALRRAHPCVGILSGGVCILVSMFAFMALESDAPTFVLFTVLVVQGVGLGLANPMLMTVITLRVPTDTLGTAVRTVYTLARAHAGTVSAIVTMLMTISSSVGMVTMLAIVASFGGVFELSAYRYVQPFRHEGSSRRRCRPVPRM